VAIDVPLVDATAPIACTLGPDEVAERVTLLERLRGHLDHVERTPHGLRLHFPAGPPVEGLVRRFAEEEARCCRFWGFAIEVGPGALVLCWDGPPGTDALVAGLHRWFEGDEPLSTVAELSGLPQPGRHRDGRPGTTSLA
jgi:hypothetical protein